MTGMTPKKIDRYEIVGEIGRGGMATVYEAHDPRFGRHVAVKVLPREFMHDPEFRGRFSREAKTIATLEHPAIVPVYDFGEDDGQPFLVMRIMRGGSLTEKMLRGPIPIEETAEIFRRIGSALDRAHSMGIVHRDMKPSNILFDEFGEAYLADFGIVQVSANSTDALTASGSLIGTPAYMSPEQVYGDKKLDGRSDIYALGVILFQMLTGSPPYIADTPARLMMKHVMDPIPQLLQMRPDLPNGFDEIITKAMAKERDERFSTAAELSTAVSSVSTQGQSSPDPIEAEMAAIREEHGREAPPAIPPALPPAAPSSEPIATPPPDSSTSSGIQIPKWVLGLAGVLLLICCGSLAAFLFVADQSRQNTEATETAVAIAEDSKRATQLAIPPTDAPTETPAATETIAATETAVATPTNTPDTAATAEQLDVRATETAVASVDLVSTRESLRQTREAEATIAPEPTAPAILLDTDKTLIYGPDAGILPHATDSLVKSAYAEVDVQNFLVQSRFETPYSVSEAGWDFGVTFRQVTPNDELRLVVRSDGDWVLSVRADTEDTVLQSGNVLPLLNLEADSINTLLMIAVEDEGYFLLNGRFIEALDLSSKVESGDLGIGTGFYIDNQVDGAETGFSDYTVWPLSMAFGPSDGTLAHIDDGFIKTESTSIEDQNFIVNAEFVNPYGIEQSHWDVGFSFRDEEVGEQYWLIVSSEAVWDLINRVEDEDTFLESGDVTNLDLASDGRNQIKLITLEQIGILFVNNEFVTTLDLSARDNSGIISVVTAFFVDHEVEGFETVYQNLTVWPLP